MFANGGPLLTTPPSAHPRALCQPHQSLCLLLDSFASLAQPLAASHLSPTVITCHKPFLR